MNLKCLSLCLLLASCRAANPGGTDSELRADTAADVPPPPQVFLDFCNNYRDQTPNERNLYEGMLIGSSTDPSGTGLGERPCGWMWDRFWRKPVVQPFKPFDDLSIFKCLIGVPRLSITIAITEKPRNLPILRQLDLVEVIFRGSGARLPSETEAELLATIAALPKLESVGLRNLRVTDLSVLAPLRHVKELRISENDITSLDFLRDWADLNFLHAPLNSISDLKPLSNLLELRRLNLSNNRIESIEPLMLLGNLIDIDLSDNPIREGILAMQYMPNLRHLLLRNSGIKNIEPLRPLPLVTLDLSDNPVETTEALRAMPLKTLNLNNTRVTDISPLADTTTLNTLILSDAPVAKLPELPANHRLQMLGLRNTAVKDPCPATRYPYLEALMLPDGAKLNRDQIRALSKKCH